MLAINHTSGQRRTLAAIVASAMLALCLGLVPLLEAQTDQAGDTTEDVGQKNLAIDRYNRAIDAAEDGRYEEAIQLYLEALDLDDTMTEAWNNLGIAYLRTGQSDEAIKAFQRVRSLRGEDSADILLNLAASHRAAREVEQALEYAKQALEQSDLSASSRLRALLVIGAVRLDTSRFEEAVDVFRDIVELAPRQAGVWFNLGIALHETERWNEARQALTEARELNPSIEDSSSDYHTRLGDIYVQTNDCERAIEHLETALALGAGLQQHLTLAECLLDLGRTASASTQLLTIEEEYDEPGRRDLEVQRHKLHLQTGRQLAEQGEDSRAAPHLIAAVENPAFEIRDADSELRKQIARAYELRGDTRRENANCREAMAAYERSTDVMYRPEVVYKSGLCALHLRQYERAVLAFEEAAGEGHDGSTERMVDAYDGKIKRAMRNLAPSLPHNLAVVQQRHSDMVWRNTHQLVSDLERLLQLAPEHRTARYSMGLVQLARGEISAARDSFAKAAGSHCDVPEACFNAGATSLLLRDGSAAEMWFRRAVKTDLSASSSETARRAMTLGAAMQGDEEILAELTSEASELSDSEKMYVASLWLSRAATLTDANRSEHAARAYGKAMELAPEDPQARLGHILTTDLSTSEKLDELGELARDSQEPAIAAYAHYHRARLLHGNGEMTAALTELESAQKVLTRAASLEQTDSLTRLRDEIGKRRAAIERLWVAQ